MPTPRAPKIVQPKPVRANEVILVASGDLRESANRVCWPAQAAMEKALGRAVNECGWTVKRAHAQNRAAGHGFIDSQRRGMDVFATIDREAPLIVAEAVWQYSHHVLSLIHI